jgi:hypothetical protein
MPLSSYAALVGIYNAIFAGALGTFVVAGKLHKRINIGDVLLLGLATHKLSRIVTKDSVTSPFRAPFTQFVESAGAGEVNEEPRGNGMQRALGELLTCPWCVSPWLAGALTAAFTASPAVGRTIAAVLSTAAISDYLNHAYELLKSASKQ